MFIYQKNNTLNFAFDNAIDNPDLVIGQYLDEDTRKVALVANGVNVIPGKDVDFVADGGQLIAFERDGKLNLTFKGVPGMANPEVAIGINFVDAIDEKSSVGSFDMVVEGTALTFDYTADSFTVNKNQSEPAVVDEPEAVDEPQEVEEPITETEEE